MAKQASPPPETAPEAAPPPKKSKRKLMLAGIFLTVMVVQGVAVFVLTKSFSHTSPASAHGEIVEGLDEHGGEKLAMDAEIEVVKLRAQNEKSQQLVIYDMTVAIAVPEKKSAKVTEIVEHKKATILDRLGRVVRALDPQRFSEPDLATLRSQFKHELGQILGDEEAVTEVLIPSIVKYNDN